MLSCPNSAALCKGVLPRWSFKLIYGSTVGEYDTDKGQRTHSQWHHSSPTLPRDLLSQAALHSEGGRAPWTRNKYVTH